MISRVDETSRRTLAIAEDAAADAPFTFTNPIPTIDPSMLLLLAIALAAAGVIRLGTSNV